MYTKTSNFWIVQFNTVFIHITIYFEEIWLFYSYFIQTGWCKRQKVEFYVKKRTTAKSHRNKAQIQSSKWSIVRILGKNANAYVSWIGNPFSERYLFSLSKSEFSRVIILTSQNMKLGKVRFRVQMFRWMFSLYKTLRLDRFCNMFCQIEFIWHLKLMK